MQTATRPMRNCVILSILLLTRAVSADDRLVLRIEPEGWGDASPDDIGKVLESAGSELLGFVPPARPLRIHVVPHDKAPQVDFQRADDGEYTVRLNVKGRFWAQFAFQFGHELCHIVSNYDRRNDNRLGAENQWFDETLCEAASLFVLDRMAGTWKEQPPYPNWKGFAPALADYAATRLKEVPSPPRDKLPVWFDGQLDGLRADPYQRDKHRVIAAHLFALLKEHPADWEAVRSLNLGRPDPANSFEAYLENWYFSVPKDRKPFVKSVVEMLGVHCPLIRQHADNKD